MMKSESTKEIAPAFLAAQKRMNHAPKDAENPHFRSRYSDFAAVVSAVKAPLNDNGIAFLQPVRMTDTGVEVETVLLHTSGEFFSETLTIPLTKLDAQAVGSAVSYGKRYGLQSICGLPSEDDDGNAASGNGAATRASQREPTPAERFTIKLNEAFDAMEFDEASRANAVKAVCNKHKVRRVTDLDAAKQERFIAAIMDGTLKAKK